MRFEAVTECEGCHGTGVVNGPDSVHLACRTCGGSGEGSRREASTSDLIEELKAKGATVRQATGEPGWYDVRSHWEIEVDREGSYLVFSLEGEKP